MNKKQAFILGAISCYLAVIIASLIVRHIAKKRHQDMYANQNLAGETRPIIA